MKANKKAAPVVATQEAALGNTSISNITDFGSVVKYGHP